MRGNLIFMELLVMVLVFALAVSVCLGIFVHARLLAEDTARLDRAVILAGNAARLWKAGQSPAIADTGDLTLDISVTSQAGLEQAEITVLHQGEPVFSLTAGRQEVLP